MPFILPEVATKTKPLLIANELFIRSDDRLARSFRRGLHARRALALRTFGRRTARLRVDRSRPTLRLQLAFILRGCSSAGGRSRARAGLTRLREGTPGAQKKYQSWNSLQSHPNLSIDPSQRRTVLSVPGFPRSALKRRTPGPSCRWTSKAMVMQVRSKTYVQVVSRLRALRVLLSPGEDPAAREASPLLTYIAVVLALLLAMLGVDSHSIELQSLGVTGGAFPVDPLFKSP
jgi:hypothetical protein